MITFQLALFFKWPNGKKKIITEGWHKNLSASAYYIVRVSKQSLIPTSHSYWKNILFSRYCLEFGFVVMVFKSTLRSLFCMTSASMGISNQLNNVCALVLLGYNEFIEINYSGNSFIKALYLLLDQWFFFACWCNPLVKL